MAFQLLTWISWRKSVDTAEKKRPKTSKFAGFESDLLTTTTIKLREVAKFYRSFYSGGGGGEASPAKHRTFAKANVSLSNLASLRMWRRSFLLPACRRREIGDVCTQAIFSAVSTDFCQMILIKSWGKPWIIITRSSTLSSVQNNWGDPVWTSKSLSIRKKGLSIFSSCSRIYTFILRTKVEITSYCN